MYNGCSLAADWNTRCTLQAQLSVSTSSSSRCITSVLIEAEGSWEEVTAIIGRAHAMLHTRGIVRVQTDIRIGTRQDKVQSMADKVDVVQRLLAADK